MNHILGGGGFSSRMMTRVRDEKGLAYDIRSGFDAGLEPGAFSVSVQTKNETAPDAVEMVLEEINRIRKALVSEAELADAKSYLIGSFLSGWTRTGRSPRSFLRWSSTVSDWTTSRHIPGGSIRSPGRRS